MGRGLFGNSTVAEGLAAKVLLLVVITYKYDSLIVKFVSIYLYLNKKKHDFVCTFCYYFYYL